MRLSLKIGTVAVAAVGLLGVTARLMLWNQYRIERSNGIAIAHQIDSYLQMKGHLPVGLEEIGVDPNGGLYYQAFSENHYQIWYGDIHGLDCSYAFDSSDRKWKIAC